MKLYVEYDDFGEYVEAVIDGELAVVGAEDDILGMAFLLKYCHCG